MSELFDVMGESYNSYGDYDVYRTPFYEPPIYTDYFAPPFDSSSYTNSPTVVALQNTSQTGTELPTLSRDGYNSGRSSDTPLRAPVTTGKEDLSNVRATPSSAAALLQGNVGNIGTRLNSLFQPTPQAGVSFGQPTENNSVWLVIILAVVGIAVSIYYAKGKF